MLYGSDTINAGIFMRSMYIEHFKETGEILQWNPYIFGGMPYVEAFHGDIFYPFSVLKFSGSLYRTLGLNLFFHIFFAGLFMYWCARQFRLSKIASLLAGVCYTFSPYLVSLVAPGHDGKIFVTTLFPLVILFTERGFNKQPFLSFTMLGLVIGTIIVSPHPQMSYFVLWAMAFFAAYKLIVLAVEKRSVIPCIRPALLVTYAVVIGLLISAIQFWPGYYYTTHFSPRADVKRGWEWSTSWAMHEEEAMGLLIPEFAGTAGEEPGMVYWGKNPFKDNSEAVGAATFFLALLGFLFARRRTAYFFGGLGIFALLYALADTTPVFKLFYWIIPKVSSLRAPSMIMFMFSFSAALLAGMGLQRVLGPPGEKPTSNKSGNWFNYILIGVPSLLGVLAVAFSVSGRSMLSTWCSLFYSEAPLIQIQQGVTKFDLALMNLPAIQSGAWFAAIGTGLVALFIWLYRTRRVGAGIMLVLVAVPLVDGIRFDSRFIRTFDQTRHWASDGLMDFFNRQDGKFRVLNLTQPNETMLPFHGVDVVVGYHGNQLRWYDDLLGGPGLTNVVGRTPNSLRPNPFMANLTGSRFILAPSGWTPPPGYFGDKPVRVIADLGRRQLIENDNALPRVFLADQYRVFGDRQDIYPAILTGQDDLRRVVYLEKEPGLPLESDSLATDSAWIVHYESDSVVVRTSSTHNNLLVFADNYFDAWHVHVDGAPAELLRAYGTFRAVALPAGASEVVFTYSSSRYANARLVTMLTSLYVLGILGFYGFRALQRRKEKEDTE